eukprot:1189353-Amphidinium_carterae.1
MGGLLFSCCCFDCPSISVDTDCIYYSAHGAARICMKFRRGKLMSKNARLPSLEVSARTRKVRTSSWAEQLL